MEKPVPQPFRDDLPAPLSFTLQQAAALCGVSVHLLSEWTECGYVRAAGHGDRRYDRDALRQILRVRDAMLDGRRPGATAREWPDSGPARPEPARRPEEFCEPMVPIDDAHLSLQVEMFFALNTGAPVSARQLCERFGVDEARMERILAAMLDVDLLVMTHVDGEAAYSAGRAQLHGPSPREQRIRATRRTRVPHRSE